MTASLYDVLLHYRHVVSSMEELSRLRKGSLPYVG